MSVPRSHFEAQEQYAAELYERTADEIREAFVRVAHLYSQPEGDAFEPIYEQLKAEWETIQKAEAYRVRKKAEAAEFARSLRGGRRCSPGGRGVVRG